MSAKLLEYDLAIYYGDGNTEGELKETLTADFWNHLKPKKTVLVCDDNMPTREFMEKYPDVVITKVYDAKSVLESYNHATPHMKSQYYVFTIAGHRLDWDWLSLLSSLIANNIRVGLVEPDERGYGLVVRNELYHMFGGTSKTNIIDKLKISAREQGCLDIIYKQDFTRTYSAEEIENAITQSSNSVSP